MSKRKAKIVAVPGIDESLSVEILIIRSLIEVANKRLGECRTVEEHLRVLDVISKATSRMATLITTNRTLLGNKDDEVYIALHLALDEIYKTIKQAQPRE